MGQARRLDPLIRSKEAKWKSMFTTLSLEFVRLNCALLCGKHRCSQSLSRILSAHGSGILLVERHWLGWPKWPRLNHRLGLRINHGHFMWLQCDRASILKREAFRGHDSYGVGV